MRTQFILIFILLKIGYSQTSQDYAKMSRNLWESFECSVLASKLNNLPERDSLFLQGYSKGKLFLKAFVDKKIKAVHLQPHLPEKIMPLLSGPSHDFILGRIYSQIELEVTKVIEGILQKERLAPIGKLVITSHYYYKKKCHSLALLNQ